MTKSIFEYFESSEDHPKNIADRGVEQNVLYCYVSSSFLDGFINYVDPIKCLLVERYRGVEDEEVHICLERYNKAHHSKLRLLGDDVLIAAQTEESYWFFWYDCDTSDCCIGRLDKRLLTEEEFLTAFCHSKVWSPYSKEGNVYNIRLKGWISF